MSEEKERDFKITDVFFNPLRFEWHVEGKVAGSARPGRYRDLAADCKALEAQGIDIIVNLCVAPLELPAEYAEKFQVVHEPVMDGHPPEPAQLERIIGLVKEAAAKGRKVVVHCRGGVGRTATVLVPLIMEMEGVSLEEAVKRLRKAGRFTQSMDQWRFIEKWAQERGKAKNKS